MLVMKRTLPGGATIEVFADGHDNRRISLCWTSPEDTPANDKVLWATDNAYELTVAGPEPVEGMSFDLSELPALLAAKKE